MHCKIRHFAQAEIQYSTDLFNRIDPMRTFRFPASGHSPPNSVTVSARKSFLRDR